MHSILDSIVENLKQELLDLFEKSPTIEDVEEFSRTKFGQVIVKLTEAYAEKVDATLYEDRAGRREWSIKTLEHLVPILATGKIELIPCPQRDKIPEPVVQAAEKAVVLTSKRTKKRFAVDPDRCVTLEVIKGGKTTPLYSALKGLGR